MNTIKNLLITRRKYALSWLVCLSLATFATVRSYAQDRDSLDIKIGQMILIGFPKAEVDSAVLREVRQGKVGSLILFEKNIPPKNSFAALKRITWTYQKAAPIPLFISIDQEGGRVNRLKEKYGFPRSITAAAMGQAHSLDSVRFYAEATAATLSGLGINVNFAPVVDLAANPDNPVIVRNGRAFSNDEDSVAMLAAEFIKQHRRYGVITSLKHFPGHGSSKHDTHLGIADVTNTWTDRELTPYKLLIDSGYADAVMTSHIVNLKLDGKGYPGTLSREILEGILRKRLNFKGVIFTDDMQMHAITKHYGLEEAIKLAVGAGVDIMTFSNNISGSDQRTVDRVHAIIKGMVKNGEIKEARIDESFRRIMKLKARLIEGEQIAFYKRELEKANVALAEAENRWLEKLQQDTIKTVVEKQPAQEESPQKKKRRKSRRKKD